MIVPLITTVKERCRVCYTCVRECPAKAIRIANGQAEILAERCIACGNCVRVCATRAKQPVSSIQETQELLASGHPVAACLAPSFPAEFTETDHRQLVGMIRALGFESVHEVSFGADLVAAEYRELVSSDRGKRYISSACPAIVGFVERYYPELVDSLAPIISPMIASARDLKRRGPDDLRVVFIGPCFAKKAEAVEESVGEAVDAVLTFAELREMITQAQQDPAAITPVDFNPPYGNVGGLYPISRGALQASGLQEDLMTGEIIATQGRQYIREAIQEFADGDLGSQLLELLCCEGCIMGAGTTSELPLFNRRRRVREYVCQRIGSLDQQRWKQELDQAAGLPFSRTFTPCDQRIPEPDGEQLRTILKHLGKHEPEDELNCGACGYDTCYEHAIAIHRGLAESEMCLPHTIERLSGVIHELEESHQQLADAQEALVQSAKLASMGQLAAGIAHEVNNPLGVVLMYAHLVLDECDKDVPVYQDVQLIAEQADRCKKIVAGLLDFARQNKVARIPVDIGSLMHGVARSVAVPSNITIRVEQDLNDPMAEIDRDQITQVLTNLVNNAVAATENTGEIVIAADGDEDWVELRVRDQGCGIPKENIKKIFEPFFTTKTMGKGTGLGLAVSYGIVKMHCGDLQVESNADPAEGPTGTTFRMKLPRQE